MFIGWFQQSKRRSCLRCILPKRSFLLCFFLETTELSAEYIHKVTFPVYGEKCLSREVAHKWVENVSLMTKRLKRKCEVAKTTVKRLLCCGLRRTGKAMGQVYQCWWRICRKINVFSPRFEYHTFYALYQFVTYLLTLPRVCVL
jgi:hypothetical protein